MKNVVIVYHSGYGHTKKQAEAVYAGALTIDSAAQLIAIDAQGNLAEADWASITAASAVIFGSPTYMGSVSWQFKKFADASSKLWSTQAWKDKIAAGFTNSASMNGDKLSTLHTMFALAMQHGMVWASAGMMPANTKAAQRNDVNFLGSYAGAIAQSPSDASTEEGPLPGDLETSRLFGIRVAQLASRMN
jgi:NAD(P)H dehydrogenase (quinone)